MEEPRVHPEASAHRTCSRDTPASGLALQQRQKSSSIIQTSDSFFFVSSSKSNRASHDRRFFIYSDVLPWVL
jgi:hypothetical protein